MKLKDYIFYRMYCVYKRNDEFARISAIAYLTVIDYFLILPFIFIFAAGFKLKGTPALLFFAIPNILILLLNGIRYIKKERLKNLIKKYSKSKYNKIIKNWMLYSLIFIVMAWGVLGMFPIGNFLMWLFK